MDTRTSFLNFAGQVPPASETQFCRPKMKDVKTDAAISTLEKPTPHHSHPYPLPSLSVLISRLQVLGKLLAVVVVSRGVAWTCRGREHGAIVNRAVVTMSSRESWQS